MSHIIVGCLALACAAILAKLVEPLFSIWQDVDRILSGGDWEWDNRPHGALDITELDPNEPPDVDDDLDGPGGDVRPDARLTKKGQRARERAARRGR